MNNSTTRDFSGSISKFLAIFPQKRKKKYWENLVKKSYNFFQNKIDIFLNPVKKSPENFGKKISQ